MHRINRGLAVKFDGQILCNDVAAVPLMNGLLWKEEFIALDPARTDGALIRCYQWAFRAEMHARDANALGVLYPRPKQSLRVDVLRADYCDQDLGIPLWIEIRECEYGFGGIRVTFVEEVMRLWLTGEPLPVPEPLGFTTVTTDPAPHFAVEPASGVMDEDTRLQLRETVEWIEAGAEARARAEARPETWRDRPPML